MAEGVIRLHTLKLREQFLYPIAKSELKAITRANSRGFNAGDYIRFRVIPLDGNSEDYSLVSAADRTAFEANYFKITFVMSGFGLKEGYATISLARETDRGMRDLLERESGKLKNVAAEQENPLDAYEPLLESIQSSADSDSAQARSYRPAHGMESIDDVIARLGDR